MSTTATLAPTPAVSRSRRAKTLTLLALGGIVLLGAVLRFYQLGAHSIGNTYYAAAVKSMLTSWHNFFFVAFEPGGSVTVDKPPLGFWMQAVSAYFLGVNGFALAFPQALAGTLSIPLLYHLVQRHFGALAGLAAALVLAIMPISIATERNNTIDGLLVFVLLLAAWAFIVAAERSQLRYLLLGALLVGAGFNIKMLQAIMPLPAFYALYLLGARLPWWKRLLHLGAASLALLAVSLAWVLAVDLTPSDQRPFIGSSTNNTVLELIVGHNGLSRLGWNARGPAGDGAGSRPQDYRPQPDNSPNLPAPQNGANRPEAAADAAPPGDRQPGAAPANGNAPQQALEACARLSAGDSCTFELPNLSVQGACQPIPQGGLACVPPNQAPNSRTPGSPPSRGNETGAAGLLRLLQAPLVSEASWLLPLALLGLPVILTALGSRLRRREGKTLGLLLWAGWLLPMLAYFSFTTGLFHRYYLIMLGPGIAALAGITLWALKTHRARNPWLGWALTLTLSGLAVTFEVFTLRQAAEIPGGAAVSIFAAWLLGTGLLAWQSARPAQYAGAALVLGALLAAPFYWSVQTTLNPNPDAALPTAGASQTTLLTPNQELLDANGEAILAYLEARTDAAAYLLATNTARDAAPFILATGRPVLTLGGFTGSDDVINLESLQSMLASGELRYILGLPQQKQEIAAWVRQNCTAAEVPGLRGQSEALYDCGDQRP